MRKITVNTDSNIRAPTEPIPSEYKLNVKEESFQQPEGNYQMPAKTMYGIDLNSLKSFKNLRANFKKKELKTVFLNDVKGFLNQLDAKGEDRFNSELLVAILNLAEQYFVYPKDRAERDQLKIECIIELMLPFFDDNEDYLLNAIGNVANRVKKSNVFRRVWARVKLYFRK